MLATIAQQAVPFAAELAPPSGRGHAVGTVMSGLLLGILLARTAAGFVAEYFGWRAVFGVSVVALLVLAVVIWLRLPKSKPTSTLPYGKLLVSMWHLIVEHRGLREASLTGACLFAAFSIFWSVLALLLAGAPFHLGPQAAGLFGIVGAAGATRRAARRQVFRPARAARDHHAVDRAGRRFVRRVRFVCRRASPGWWWA